MTEDELRAATDSTAMQGFCVLRPARDRHQGIPYMARPRIGRAAVNTAQIGAPRLSSANIRMDAHLDTLMGAKVEELIAGFHRSRAAVLRAAMR